MSYAKLIERHRRRDILVLLRDGGGEAGEEVMLAALREVGYPKTTADQLRRDVDDMRTMGLVTVSWFGERVAVASLTERGLDAVAGRIDVDGVARPERVG